MTIIFSFSLTTIPTANFHKISFRIHYKLKDTLIMAYKKFSWKFILTKHYFTIIGNITTLPFISSCHVMSICCIQNINQTLFFQEAIYTKGFRENRHTLHKQFLMCSTQNNTFFEGHLPFYLNVHISPLFTSFSKFLLKARIMLPYLSIA